MVRAGLGRVGMREGTADRAGRTVDQGGAELRGDRVEALLTDVTGLLAGQPCGLLRVVRMGEGLPPSAYGGGQLGGRPCLLACAWQGGCGGPGTAVPGLEGTALFGQLGAQVSGEGGDGGRVRVGVDVGRRGGGVVRVGGGQDVRELLEASHVGVGDPGQPGQLVDVDVVPGAEQFQTVAAGVLGQPCPGQVVRPLPYLVQGTADGGGTAGGGQLGGHDLDRRELRFECRQPGVELTPLLLAFGEPAGEVERLLGLSAGLGGCSGMLRGRAGGGVRGSGKAGDPVGVGLEIVRFGGRGGLGGPGRHPGEVAAGGGQPLARDLGLVGEPLFGVLEPADGEQPLEQPFPRIVVGLQEVGEAPLR